jgi:hypothetical protein
VLEVHFVPFVLILIFPEKKNEWNEGDIIHWDKIVDWSSHAHPFCFLQGASFLNLPHDVFSIRHAGYHR